MANGVDASMHPVKTAGPDALVDRGLAPVTFQKLLPRHEPMLMACENCELLVINASP